MLYFVVPLRAPSTTDDWVGVCQLLRRTLLSVCNQTDRRFRVLVVGHSLPVNFELPGNCDFIAVPFDPPLLTKTDDIEQQLWLMRTDKGRKMLHGLARVRVDPGAYVMFLDADDLVSNRLAGVVSENRGTNGWFFEYGYRMDIVAGGRSSLYWRKKFYRECGSSYILRADLAPFPEKFDDTADFSDYYVRRYVVHNYVKEDFEKRRLPLSQLPFYGAIYTFNGRNIYAESCRSKDSIFRVVGRNLFKRRRITRSVTEEFGIGDV